MDPRLVAGTKDDHKSNAGPNEADIKSLEQEDSKPPLLDTPGENTEQVDPAPLLMETARDKYDVTDQVDPAPVLMETARDKNDVTEQVDPAPVVMETAGLGLLN